MIAPGAAWLLFSGVLLLDFLAVVYYAAGLLSRRSRHRRHREAQALAVSLLGEPDRTPDPRWDRFARRNRRPLLEAFSRTVDSIQLSDARRQTLAGFLERNRLHAGLVRDLHARSRYRRTRAAAFLPLVPTPAIRASLVRALETERSPTVRLALCACLTTIGETAAVPSIIDTLAGQPLRYQRSLRGLLSEFGEGLAAYLPMLVRRPEKEIQLLLIHFASRHPSSDLRDYLVTRVESPDLDVSREAFRTLATAYAGSLDHERYLAHDDYFIRSLAAESIGRLPTVRSLELLFRHYDDPIIQRSVVLGLTAILRAQPGHLRRIMMRCLHEQRPVARGVLVDVLSGYVDHLAEKLLTPEAETAQRLLAEIVRRGRLSEFADFLNRNANPRIEKRALAVLAGLVRVDPSCAARIRQVLDQRLLARLGLEKEEAAAQGPRRPQHPRRRLLTVFLAVGLLLVPGLSLLLCVLAPPMSGAGTALPPAARFLVSFNILFAFYAVSLNAIYLVLLGFSAAGAARQGRYRSLQRLSLLFKEGILPSVSIISPAFNEEASIVESVSALLTLRYPDYEVIVVNDGSGDHTLGRLVGHFGLERTDVFIHRYLNTEEVRGVYASRKYPELLVIDKVNGGKADALNAGLNVARKEYFAGIDADSLLERDALLNLTALFLLHEEEVVAGGGNILPVNGCTVSRGTLVETRIPRRSLARFQTVEYLRAFMAGRIGWSMIKSLLIISGAFGVFNRRRVIDAHGYLTRNEHYAKDTVGEDMELVVRLTRGLRESRTPFAIEYGHDANCWTEIPESFKVLSRQRDRWQRGLLDIVTFHFHMMFNPAYGRTGLVGFPYFLLYEVLGPWFEIEGYLVLAASLVLGMVPLPLFLLIFTATVLLGVLVSVASLLIAESRREYFGLPDKLRLVLHAVIENFGFRQLMNLLRVRGFLRLLGNVQGWGAMERRGMGRARIGKGETK